MVQVATTPVASGGYTADNTSPELVKFDLDMNLHVLTLFFNEPVDRNTFEETAVNLVSNSDTFTFADGTLQATQTGALEDVLYMDIVLTDSNSIKQKLTIATEDATTSISISQTPTLVLDMASQPFDEHTGGVAVYTPDNTDPVLESFDLDLTAETLTLHFSETISKDSLTIGEITLQSHAADPDAAISDDFETRTLTAVSTTSSPDGPTIVINLGKADLNEITRLTLLATGEDGSGSSGEDGSGVSGEDGRDTTFVTMTTLAFTDTALVANEMEPVVGEKASTYKKDDTPPTLESFEIDLTTEKLLLKFSETVKVSTFTKTAPALQEVQVWNGVGTNPNQYEFTDLVTVDADATTLEFSISDTDLNAIKKMRDLAVSTSSTYLAFPSDMISDMAGNPVTEVLVTLAQLTADFLPDVKSPTLVEFELSMDGDGTLTMTFDETMKTSTIEVGQITFENSDASASYELTAGVFSVLPADDSTVLVLTLDKDDLDAIKKMTNLCVSEATTYLKLSSTAALDMNNRNLTPVTMKVKNGGFDEDVTPPTLIKFDLNMNTHEITFLFSETVSRDTFVVERVTIVGTNSEEYPLEVGAMIDSQVPYSTSLAWKMDDADANALKRLRSTAVSIASSSILMADGAVQDANGQAIVAFSTPHPCDAHFPDETSPDLVSYTMDLTAGIITMQFSEAIKSSSLVAVGVRVLAGRGPTESSVQGCNGVALTSGSLKVDLDADGDASTRSDWLTAVIALSEDDMNAIKKCPALAVSDASTYLSIDSSVITDMNNRPFNAIASSVAQKVQDSGFEDDQVDPILRSFALDMSQRLLTLSFSETMLASSIVMGANTLVFTHGDGVALAVSSANVDVTGEDTNVITIQLSEADANAMKIAGSGRTLADSSLKIHQGWALDMNNNAVVLTDLALLTSDFIADTIPPVMRSASIDMNLGTLTIVFDETVKADSLEAGTITVQSDAAGTVKHTLLGPGTNINTDNSPTIVVQMVVSDLNAIKLKDMLTVIGDSYVYLAPGTVTDTSVAATLAVAHGDDAANFARDATDPVLSEFSFDLTTKSLVLTFDEVVKADSLEETEITLWSHASQQAADTLGETRRSHTLAEVDVDSSNGLTITLILSDGDLDTIKAIENLYVGPTSAYLSLTALAATDMAVPPNTVKPIFESNAKVADRFKSDNIQPRVTQVDLDMTTELLTIYFSETVDSSSVLYQGITLQKSANVGSTIDGHVTLSGGTRTHTTDIPSLQIKLTNDDLNKMKSAKIGMDKDSSYLVMTAASIKDMAGLDLIPREDGVVGDGGALQVTDYARDSTDPVLTSCALDLDAETFTLGFSETVDAGSILVQHFTLAQDQLGVQTTYSLHAPSGTSSADGPEIVVDISLSDLNEIKRLSELGLATKGGAETSVFCSISTLFIDDVFENHIEARDVGNGLPSINFGQDNTPPTLLSFSLDMNQVVSENTVQVATATILLKFSETVKFSTYEPTAITIQKDRTVTGIDSSVTLSGEFASVSTQSGTTLSFKLLRDDANAIKKIADLATSFSDTFITLTSNFVDDMSGNSIRPEDNGAALQISNNGFVPDETAPELLRFDIDMDKGKLTLSYDETVNGLSINPDEIVIRDTTNVGDAAASFTLTGGVVGSADGEPWVKVENERSFPHADSHIISFYFTKADLDEIKRLNMCSEANDCYLVHTEFLVYDMRANDVLRCT